MPIFELLQAGHTAAGLSVFRKRPDTPLPRPLDSLKDPASAAGLEFASRGWHACLHMHRVAPVSA